MVRKGARRGATPELKSQSSPSSVAPRRLVLCLLNGWCFAARIFPSRRGASDEHIPQWICKERATKPGAKRTAALWVAPSLACGFVARRSQPHCGGCSLLAPRHRPNWAQQNTSHLGDTTLARACCKSPFCSRSADAYIRELFENPCHVRADVGIRAPILPLSQQPLASAFAPTSLRNSSCHRQPRERQISIKR